MNPRNEYIRQVDLKSLPLSFSGSRVNISRITHYQKRVSDSPFSLKLLLEGEEVYWVNGKKYVLKKDQFLLVNRHATVQFDIDCKRPAMGICFYPSLDLLAPIIHGATHSPQDLLDQPAHSSSQLGFTEKVYYLKESQTGKMLARHYAALLALHQGYPHPDWDSFMLQLCENLVCDQLKVNRLLSYLPSKKKSTQEELYRRVSAVKVHLDTHYTEPIDLDAITEKAMLSKYHLVRSFKALVGLSPIKYLLQLRLSEAQKLRQQGHSYQEIAATVGFSDARNLRKAMVRMN